MQQEGIALAVEGWPLWVWSTEGRVGAGPSGCLLQLHLVLCPSCQLCPRPPFPPVFVPSPLHARPHHIKHSSLFPSVKGWC